MELVELMEIVIMMVLIIILMLLYQNSLALFQFPNLSFPQ
jgi:hypothetical protein